MEFKTNAKWSECQSAIESAVKKSFPNAELKLDLESEDKVLHVHGIPETPENAALIERNIEEAGFKGSWLTRGQENK